MTVSKAFEKLLQEGYVIRATSCNCGGWWAWISPDNKMVGCICHHHPIAILKGVKHSMPIPKNPPPENITTRPTGKLLKAATSGKPVRYAASSAKVSKANE